MIVQPYVFEGLSSDDEPVVMTGITPAMSFTRDVAMFTVGLIVGATVVVAVALA